MSLQYTREYTLRKKNIYVLRIHFFQIFDDTNLGQLLPIFVDNTLIVTKIASLLYATSKQTCFTSMSRRVLNH